MQNALNIGGRDTSVRRARPVQRTSELRRILELPRRVWETSEDLSADMTEWLKKPAGKMALRRIQATMLAEAHDHGGAFGPIRVGGGKTLISFLAPVVLEAKRPLLLVPAKLRDKTKTEFLTLLAPQWQAPSNLTIESYERLGRIDKRSGEPIVRLELLSPDLIICDEVHRLKNPKAACTRRVARYMKHAPETKFLGMSGTITNRSLRDFAHILFWCLKHRAPLPLEYKDLEDWADALDEKVASENRMDPGALKLFADPKELKELDELAAVRRGFRRRLVETPGVVATSEKHVGASISITCVEPNYSEETEKAFRTLRSIWETPDGWPIADGVTLWRHARELALGFFYKWDPRPPQAWLTARQEWCACVRHILSTNRRGLDSELQVSQAVSKGEYGDDETDAYTEWARVRHTFKPITVPVWLDNGPLELATEWIKRHRGIVWVEHRAVGEKLSEVAKVTYYGSGGVDRRGAAIETAEPKRSLIASIASSGEGRNLQAWAENLITSPVPTGRIVEQLLGRTHRDNQEADEVTFDVIVGCKEQYNALIQAKEDCRFIEDSTGQPMKILYADKLWPSPEQVAAKAIGSYRYR